MRTLPITLGDFAISERLAITQMSEVYRGTSDSLGLGIIKVLRSELNADAAARARFAREAETHQELSGPWVPDMLEVGLDGEPPYYVTRDLGVPNLQERVDQDGPLGERDLWRLALDLTEFLVHLHSRGIVHRDLKPANVAWMERLQVFDFGLAVHSEDADLTDPGQTLGSPRWMAPERFTGKAGTPSDVFACGLTVAYAGTGRHPFGLDGPSATDRREALKQAPDLTGLPARLLPAVTAALRYESFRRPNASQLLGLLLSDGQRSGDTRDMGIETTAVLSASPRDKAVDARWSMLVEQLKHDRDHWQENAQQLQLQLDVQDALVNGLSVEVDAKRQLERQQADLQRQLSRGRHNEQQARQRAQDAEAAQETAEQALAEARHALEKGGTATTTRRPTSAATHWLVAILVFILTTIVALRGVAVIMALPEKEAAKHTINAWLVRAGLPAHDLPYLDPDQRSDSLLTPLLQPGRLTPQEEAANAAWRHLEDMAGSAGNDHWQRVLQALDAFASALYEPPPHADLVQREQALVLQLIYNSRIYQPGSLGNAYSSAAAATSELFRRQR